MFGIKKELMGKIKEALKNAKPVSVPQTANGAIMFGCGGTCTGSCRTGCATTCKDSANRW